MRILFAGATGVIGQRVLPQLLIAGHEVTAVARFAHTQAELLQIGVASTTASLFDPDAVRAAVQGHDIVINLATHVPPSTKALRARAWRETGRIRREGSANLSAAAKAAGASLFIQESFAPIYEARGDAWIDEASSVRPAKYNRETIARSQRISNRKLRESCDWAPRYPSVREGYRAVVAQLERH